MPEVKRFRVTQVREVEVDAHSATEAILIAGVAFEHGQNSNNGVKMVDPQSGHNRLIGVWGNTTSKIQEVTLTTEKVR